MPLDASFDIDIRDWETGANAMIRAARNLKPVWRRLEIPMELDQESHFAKQEGPDGKWPKRAASTLDARRRRGRNKGKMLGKLKTAFKIAIERKSIEAFSLVEWAESHQFGGTVGRGSRLPRREHLYIGAKFAQLAFDEIGKFLTAKFARGR